MRLDVFIHHEPDPQLTKVLGLLEDLARGVKLMSKELDELSAAVAANTDTEASAILLIQGIAAQIAANADDPAKLTALTSKLKSSAAALAEAITANTPGGPTP